MGVKELQRPILTSPIFPFSATQSKVFEFSYSGGAQAIRNNLVIERTSNNSIVYSNVQETFSLAHTLPMGILTNGIEYRARIRVGDISNTWSQFSDWIVFMALSDSVVTIDNIDYSNQNRVYNQSILFEATYTQAEYEPINSYRFLLHDANQNLIKAFPEKYPSSNLPPTYITQNIDALENGKAYYLEVVTLSKNGSKGSSGKIRFTPFYLAPKIHSALTPINLPEQGAVKVSANILQLIGKLYNRQGAQINSTNVEFLNGDWIDLTRPDYGKLIFSEGFFTNQSDFILQLWCKNIPDNTVFLKLKTPTGGCVDLFKQDNCIRAHKYHIEKTVVAFYSSSQFVASANEAYMICLKQINHVIQITVDLL